MCLGSWIKFQLDKATVDKTTMLKKPKCAYSCTALIFRLKLLFNIELKPIVENEEATKLDNDEITILIAQSFQEFHAKYEQFKIHCDYYFGFFLVSAD